ncbi:MAG: hypothetical protein ACXVPQ_05805 [Bacteroidia bacterium]
MIQLIAAPQKGGSEEMARLLSLKKQFPFFQSAHLLLTLISKRHDSSLFQQTLKSTAITVPNRSRLYHLLNEAIEELNGQAVPKPETEPVVTVQSVAETTQQQETLQPAISDASEIEHLKAIEMVSEKEEAPSEEELNKQVEKEVEKQIVSAFVEKEILHTPDLHKTVEKKEAGSFTDWLKVLKNDTPAEQKEQKPQPKRTFKPPLSDKKSEQKSIIDKVIEMNPGNIRLNPNQKFFAADNKAKESLLESEDLVTETLAKIYALQGNTSKAVRAYEILSLKFPQKSAYFATLIENLKKGT